MYSRFFIAITLVFTLSQGFAQNTADDILGIWQSGGDEPARIQIWKFSERYYGKIVWLQNPVKDGKARTDQRNPDESKRNQPIIGLMILKGFKFDGDDEWESGKIYDPQSGKTYKSYITLKDKNTMKLRGYVGISLLGRTEVWNRVSE